MGLSVLYLAGCGSEGSSFSLLSDSDTFSQSPGTVNDKIDILWVIDSSGSMDSSQQNLASNFNSFISDFQSKNLDFKMAVTGTDAYRKLYSGGNPCSQFRDGPIKINYGYNPVHCETYGTHSGVRVITPAVTNYASVFINSVIQGVQGHGDERPLQSLQVAFDDAQNAGFLRNDSFLSVIILTDEDDFSHNGSSNIQGVSYSDSRLIPVTDYVNYLDTLTGTSGASRRYNVNSIAIYDQACLDSLNSQYGGRMIGQRVGELADATGGLKTSLCGNFANDLASIAENILSLATQFHLSRIPKVETIVVKVNGSVVPNKDNNPGPQTGGWEYVSDTNSIKFTGDYIPAAGSSISVTFDPVAYGS